MCASAMNSKIIIWTIELLWICLYLLLSTKLKDSSHFCEFSISNVTRIDVNLNSSVNDLQINVIRSWFVWNLCAFSAPHCLFRRSHEMWTEKRQTNINWKLYDLWLSEKWTIFRAYEKVQCTNEYGCNIIEKRHERTMFIDPRAPIEGTLKTTTVLYGPFKYITPTTKWQFVGSTKRKNGGKTIFASFRWFQHNCIAHVQTRTHTGCISVCSSTPAYVFIFHAINSRKRARTHHANKHRGNR